MKRLTQISGAPFRFLGDLFRDKRQWQQAAWLYRAYVILNPHDAALQVQLGNCSKEAGSLANAARAYDRALALKPDDSETRAALQFVRDVLSTRQSQAGTALLLQQVPRPALMWIDITDIMIYFHANSNINGIQRVILAFIRNAQAHAVGFASDVRFCQRVSEADPVREITPDTLKSFVDGAMARQESGIALKLLVQHCRGGVPVRFQPGDVFLILGAFWIAPRYDDLLNHLKQQNVATGLFVYDLIPVTHGQFVHPNSGKNFKRKLAHIIALCDFSLAISEFVAREVQEFVQSTQQRGISVLAVPLAHELPAADLTAKVSRAIAALETTPFALCVSTLEARKNQAYLIEIWQKLHAVSGKATPKLVLVGRWGWGSQRLATVLKASRLSGVIIEVHTDVNDAELAFLYEHCAFSLMPSLVEGWGLPIGESLGHGKPCFASSGSSMSEVGGEFVRYFDPLKVDDGLAKIMEVLDNPENLASWKAKIANNFAPRSWRQFSNDLVVKAWTLARSDTVRVPNMSVVPCAEAVKMERSLKVLTLSLYPVELPLHGGQRRLNSIVSMLRKAGHEVRTAGVLGDPSYPNSDHYLRFPGTYALNSYIFNPSLMEDWSIGQLFAKDDRYYQSLVDQISWIPDIIFVEQPWLFAFAHRYNDTTLGGAARLIYSSQNVEHHLKHSIMKQFFGAKVADQIQPQILSCEKFAIENADQVFCVSESDVIWHSAYSKCQPTLATNGVNDGVASFDDMRSANSLTGGRKFALYCGSGHPPNVAGFFDIFGNGAGSFPPDSLLVVAGGAGASIQQSPEFHRASGIPAVYRDLGIVNDGLLRGLLETAHVIILPITQGGGTNLKTAEAIWSGRHVVATPIAMRGFEDYTQARGISVASDPPSFLADLRTKLSLPRLELTVNERTARRNVLWEHTLANLVTNISK